MDSAQIINLYDDEYASAYEGRFIHSPVARSDSNFELDLLRGFLRPGVSWLDVACGTGYFLSQFPTTRRAGLDLSPSMLKLRKGANPGVEFFQHDMRARGRPGKAAGAWFRACGTPTAWSSR